MACTLLPPLPLQKDPCLPDLYWVGPPLEAGPLPALFYFCLSAESTLTTLPFCMPLKVWASYPLRIFSVDLPYHGASFAYADPDRGPLLQWAKALAENFLTAFVEKVQALLHQVEKQKLLSGPLGAAGLSRGAFMAAHLAAKIPQVEALLGFAPLTSLESLPECATLAPSLVESSAVALLSPQLCRKKVRFYCGNNDQRVGTKRSFNVIETLVCAAQEQKIRSLPAELILYPSIGHKGHGTPETIFCDGAKWIADVLCSKASSPVAL